MRSWTVGTVLALAAGCAPPEGDVVDEPAPSRAEPAAPPEAWAEVEILAAQQDSDEPADPALSFWEGVRIHGDHTSPQLEPGDIEFVAGHGFNLLLGKNRTYRTYIRGDSFTLRPGSYRVSQGGLRSADDTARWSCNERWCHEGTPADGVYALTNGDTVSVNIRCDHEDVEALEEVDAGLFVASVPDRCERSVRYATAGYRDSWTSSDRPQPGRWLLGTSVQPAPPEGARWIRGPHFSLLFLELPGEGWPRAYRLGDHDLAVDRVGGCGHLEGTRAQRSTDGVTSVVGTFCGRMGELVSGQPVAVVVAVGPDGALQAARALPGLSLERTAVNEGESYRPAPGTNRLYATYRATPGADLSGYALRCSADVDTREATWMLEVDTVPAAGPIPLTCVGPKRGTPLADQDHTIWPAPRVGPSAVTVISDDRFQVVDTDGSSVQAYAPVAVDDGIRVDPASTRADFDEPGDVAVWMCVLPESGVRRAGDPPELKVNAVSAACGWAISKPVADDR